MAHQGLLVSVIIVIASFIVFTGVNAQYLPVYGPQEGDYSGGSTFLGGSP